MRKPPAAEHPISGAIRQLGAMPHRKTSDRLDRDLALERYRSLVEGALQGICIYDESRIFFANRTMADMLGYTVDELLALSPEEVARLVHSDDRQQVLERVAMRLTGKPAPRRVQLRLVRRDGSAVPVEGLTHAIECDGRPAVFGSFVDIAPLHRVDNALRIIARGVASTTGQDFLKALTRHLAEALGASHALVAEFTSDRRDVARSLAAVADGHEAPSFECALASDLRPIFPGASPSPDATAECFAATLLEDQAGRPLGVLAVVNRTPLPDRDLASTVLEVNAGRVGAEMVGVRTEAALRRALGWRDAIVEGAPDAIFISDAAARFVTVNAAACKLTGYSREELLGMRIPDLHDRQDLGAYRRFHSRIMKGTDAVTSAPVRRRDGTKATVEFNNRLISVEGAPHMLTLARDVTERLRVEDEIRRSRQRLRRLTRGLLATQERERSRIAMELHDQVGQDLTAIKLAIGAARAAAPVAAREMEAITDLLDRVLETVRTLSFELRPSTLDELGLAAALRGYVTRHTAGTGLDSRLSLDDLPEGIPPDVETACFRIAQEAVTNVLRHAHATRLSVRLRGGAGGVELVVEDDGVGLKSGVVDNAELAGLGIAGMHERAGSAGGRLTLGRRARGGTRLRATFPLPRTTDSPP